MDNLRNAPSSCERIFGYLLIYCAFSACNIARSPSEALDLAIYSCRRQKCTSITLNSELFSSIYVAQTRRFLASSFRKYREINAFRPTRDMLVATAGTY
jgi:hypothetical protein